MVRYQFQTKTLLTIKQFNRVVQSTLHMQLDTQGATREPGNHMQLGVITLRSGEAL